MTAMNFNFLPYSGSRDYITEDPKNEFAKHSETYCPLFHANEELETG